MRVMAMDKRRLRMYRLIPDDTPDKIQGRAIPFQDTIPPLLINL
jgi:hypothetical protein